MSYEEADYVTYARTVGYACVCVRECERVCVCVYVCALLYVHLGGSYKSTSSVESCWLVRGHCENVVS